MVNYTVLRTRHDGKEPMHFRLMRQSGTEDYLLLHFKTPVIFTLFDKSQRIEAGTCILLSPGTPHGFYPDGCDLVHDWMHFLPGEEKEFLKLKIDTNTFFYPVDTSIITTAVKRCEHELIYKNDFYSDIISAEVTGLLIRLKRQMSGNTHGNHTDALKALRLDIYRNPSSYPGTIEMADAVSLSRSRFSVVYNQLFGTAPKTDLINARVSKASYLLSLGTLSLAEIAEMCGYQNVYHFIRQFRMVTGITPGKYRKQ